MILQFLWESRGRLFKESYSNVTLLFFVFVHIAPSLLHKTHPLLPRGGFPKPHIIRPFYLGVVFLVLFWKSTKNFGLAFLRVSGRRGCLKRPLRASDLFGVSATIPTVPPFPPQNPTAYLIKPDSAAYYFLDTPDAAFNSYWNYLQCEYGVQ